MAEAHKRNLKVVIDLVLSHTSEEHAWFKESRASRNNPKSSWYVWADPKPDGTVPNNWLSIFGGPAWQFDTRRGQYFMHNFLKSQPDLNLHNVEVQDALLSAAEFWLKRGVDGFRLDVANFYMCDRFLRDNPPRPKVIACFDFDPLFAYCVYGRILRWIRQFRSPTRTTCNCICTTSRRKRTFSSSSACAPSWTSTTTLCPSLRSACHSLSLSLSPPGCLVWFANHACAQIGDDRGVVMQAAYVAGSDRLHTAYSFDLLSPTLSTHTIRAAVEQFFQQPGGGWPAWAFSNHDFPRAVSRWGHGEPALGKVLMALLCALRGTIFVYQGEELALTEAKIPFELLQDPYGIEMWPEMPGRDGCRTPMPWTRAGPAAGFSAGHRPWLPIPEEHRERAVDVQESDADSMLAFTRAFLEFRRQWRHVLGYGTIQFCQFPDTHVLAFTRRARNPVSGLQEQLFCAFNLTAAPVLLHQPEWVHYELAPLQTGLAGSYAAATRSVTLPAFGGMFAAMQPQVGAP
jgi:alpha-glucosidase